jgi:4-amino-4-deoxy-L-arabinose transferase-like glycosyltransferase
MRLLGDSKAKICGALVAIILFGALLRLYRIGHQAAWADEALAIDVAHAPLKSMISFFIVEGSLGPCCLKPAYYQLGNASRNPWEWNPPIYHYALHEWFRMIGYGVWESRLLSALAGILCLPLVFLIARRLYDANTALLATLFMALSQLAVRYSQETRPYELASVFFLATVYFYLVATDQQSLAAWCWCTAFAVLTAGTHYFAAIGIVALAAYLVIYRRVRPVPWKWIAGSTVAGLLALTPWILLVRGSQVHTATSSDLPRWWRAGAGTIFQCINDFNNGKLAGFEDSAPRWTFVVGGLLFSLPALLMIWRSLKKSGPHADPTEQKNTILAAVLCVVPVAVVVSLGLLAKAPFAIRYVSFYIAPYYVLSAAGILRLRLAGIRWLMILAGIAYSGYALRANYFIPYKEDFGSAVRYITQRSRPGDCYAFEPFDTVPWQWWVYTSQLPTPLVGPGLQALSAAHCSRVWLINYERETYDPQFAWHRLTEELRSDYREADHQQYFWVGVDLYTSESESTAATFTTSQ